MESFKEFINSRPEPSMDRRNDKYYPEMQQLTYNLLRYLGMNEDPNEHPCQGNYNMTYLVENMTNEELYEFVGRFIRRLNQTQLIYIIERYTGADWGKPVIESIEEMSREIKHDGEKKYLIEAKLKDDTYEWFEAEEDKELLDKITEVKKISDISKITLYEKRFEVR